VLPLFDRTQHADLVVTVGLREIEFSIFPFHVEVPALVAFRIHKEKFEPGEMFGPVELDLFTFFIGELEVM
jgi:hypothetical protein